VTDFFEPAPLPGSTGKGAQARGKSARQLGKGHGKVLDKVLDKDLDKAGSQPGRAAGTIGASLPDVRRSRRPG
jgi:hypothetical protein